MAATKIAQLRAIFPAVDADVISAVLLGCDGDTERAASELVGEDPDVELVCITPCAAVQLTTACGTSGTKRSMQSSSQPDEVEEDRDLSVEVGIASAPTPCSLSERAKQRRAKRRLAPEMSASEPFAPALCPCVHHAEIGDEVLICAGPSHAGIDLVDECEIVEKDAGDASGSMNSFDRMRDDDDMALACRLAARERKHEERRHLREQRDAAIAREMARLWVEREVEQNEHAALAFQAQEGGMQGCCRYCKALCWVSSAEMTPMCSNEDCAERGKHACEKRLSCGHPCCGVRGEAQCDVPCCECGDGSMQNCGVCLDKFSESPSILLDCGHAVHYGCAVSMVDNVDWRGRRVTFAALSCPGGCGRLLSHKSLASRMDPILAKQKQVERNVVQRAFQDDVKRRGRSKESRADKGENENASTEGAVQKNPNIRDLLSKYVYYECYRCREPYFGGLAECQAGNSKDPDPETVQCSSCMLDGKGGACPKHGAEFMAVKCDYCCNEALFRCGGSTMYCEPCHSPPTSTVKPCDPAKCPLGGQHPQGKTSQWMMGCAACRCENT